MKDLSTAIKENDLGAIQSLLNSGMEINSPYSNGWTPLTSAAFHGKQEVIDFLLNHGADVDIPNEDAWTPLMVAAYFNHSDVVISLVTHGADVEFENIRGENAVSLATDKGNQAIIVILTEGSSTDNGNPDIPCFLIRRTDGTKDEFEDFNLSKNLYAEILRLKSFQPTVIKGWGEYRVKIEGAEISFSEEPVGLQVCFENNTLSLSIILQVVEEIRENITRITGKSTEIASGPIVSE